MTTETLIDPAKPLGRKNYGSIAHFSGSRVGIGDHHLSEGQKRIATVKTRDKHDLVIVQEKLDGSNVGVAKINGAIVPITRAGRIASASRFDQHRHFATWAMYYRTRFDLMLSEGERVCGEWLMQAHGTRYALMHEPFVAFDIMRGDERVTIDELESRCAQRDFVTPLRVHYGGACSIKDALGMIETLRGVHGAIDQQEGCVWRVERAGKVDFLAKYVRPDKRDGCYLPEMSGRDVVWNITPKALFEGVNNE